MIPEAAVEAAARVLEERTHFYTTRSDLARAALEAAAPHLMAEAWSAGRGAGQMDPHELYPTPNPYRSNP